MKLLKNILNKMSKQKGQALVEYGILLFVSIIAASALWSVKDSTVAYLRSVFSRESQQNRHDILTPGKPDPEEIWNNSFETVDRTHPMRPVAYFAVSNPVYTNEPVHYWDGSYDPDGIIVATQWTGNQTIFTSPGKYTVTLTVTDNDNMTDTYSLVITVVDRGEYTKLINDHPNEERVEIGRSQPYNVGTEKSLIIEHVYGTRKDLYNVEHLVIEENLWKHSQERNIDITYSVKIPVIEVTYDGNHNEISRRPYTQNGRQVFVEQTEVQTIPYEGDIGTGSEGDKSGIPENNNWVFYVYNKYSSVRNQSMSPTGWGDRNPSADYPRFAPEQNASLAGSHNGDTWIKLTRQDPEGWITSRDSYKIANYANNGYLSPTTNCKTCTEPHKYELKDIPEYDHRSISCSGSGEMDYTDRYGDEHTIKSSMSVYRNSSGGITNQSYGDSGVNGSKLSNYSRVRNWIEHENYDIMYKYSGTGQETGSSSEIKLTRKEWITDGWKKEEMVGTGTVTTPRMKYTECDNNSQSDSNCWKTLSVSASNESGWSSYRSDWGKETRTCQYGGGGTCSWSWTDYYKTSLSCSWYGDKLTTSNPTVSFSTKTEGTSSCDPPACKPAPTPTPAPSKAPTTPKK